MHLSPENVYRLKQLFFIVLYWVTMTRIVVSLEFYSVDGQVGSMFDLDLFASLRHNMITATLSGLAIGIVTGLGEVFLFKSIYFRSRSFLQLMVIKMLAYFLIIAVIAMATAYLYLVTLRGSEGLEAMVTIFKLLNSNGFYHLLMIGLLLSFGINFLLIIQGKMGPRIFTAILSGKYHKPREEHRIFLFADLKSSTEMAERLGHKEYSRLIQQCFKDFAEMVIRFRGDIYQFVGDEVVVTWKAKNTGHYTDSIRLFFAFRQFLVERNELYKQRYGVLPAFKGAVHAGPVMVAEVGGTIKSEIAYHGDVLNTTSRMMELCKFYKKDLIISEEVSYHLNPEECNADIRLEGEIQLRGKNNKLRLFSAEQKRVAISNC
jgi:adenylate cyclase